MEDLPPVEAVVLGGGMSLLVDESHRAYLAYQRGEEAVTARIAFDDEGGSRACFCGACGLRDFIGCT
jgi:hypothetical protein